MNFFTSDVKGVSTLINENLLEPIIKMLEVSRHVFRAEAKRTTYFLLLLNGHKALSDVDFPKNKKETIVSPYFPEHLEMKMSPCKYTVEVWHFLPQKGVIKVYLHIEQCCALALYDFNFSIL